MDSQTAEQLYCIRSWFSYFIPYKKLVLNKMVLIPYKKLIFIQCKPLVLCLTNNLVFIPYKKLTLMRALYKKVGFHTLQVENRFLV